jgi:hypothetical protein
MLLHQRRKVLSATGSMTGEPLLNVATVLTAAWSGSALNAAWSGSALNAAWSGSALNAACEGVGGHFARGTESASYASKASCDS